MEQGGMVGRGRAAVVMVMLVSLVAAVLATVAAPQAGAGHTTPVDACAGATMTLAANDDGSAAATPLGFDFNFFGTTYTHTYVNNNGNLTFNGAFGSYTPTGITGATGNPAVAPFWADVDTRGAGSGLVRYGQTTYAGRDAFCAIWPMVGYYSGHTDKLNTFQAILVERSDRGAGDVDIYFNYDQLVWNTGDASDGSGGFGGTPAVAGFTAGTGVAGSFFQFPGSLVDHGLTDDNAVTGLHNYPTNTSVDGSHRFSVRNGGAPTGGTVQGTTHLAPDVANFIADAPVRLCRVLDEVCTHLTFSGPNGDFVLNGVEMGQYRLTADPPAGQNVIRTTTAPFDVAASGLVMQNIAMTAPTAPPPTTRVIGATDVAPGDLPVVIVGQPFQLRRDGCDGGVGSFEIRRDGALLLSGGMAENPAGVYTATITPIWTGVVEVLVRVSGCPDVIFNMYIDPSGHVRTTDGTPIPGATVTLYRSDAEAGPFTQVPDGDAIMSPSNRTNPDTTDGTGHFGWDVIPGYYFVRATAAGCHAPGDTGQAHVDSYTMEIPPPVTDLDLRLECAEGAVPTPSLPGVVAGSTNFQLRSGLTAGAADAGVFDFGSRPSVPVMGDWDGDGDRTPGYYKGGRFYLRNDNTPGAAQITFAFGDRRGFPVVGDWNGDGTETVGVFRNGKWQLTNALNGSGGWTVNFGSGTWPTTVPVTGDWDGDGDDELGTYRYGNGNWALRSTSNGGATVQNLNWWQGAGSYPVVGDWDDDNVDTVGVRKGATWHLSNDNAGPADVTFDFGLASDLPVVWRAG